MPFLRAPTATLSEGARDAGTSWTLTRTASGATSSVQATLTDAMPVTFTVVKGETTPLVFHFAIESVGDVTFGTGTGVTAGIQVDAGTSAVSTIKITGTASMTAPTLHGSTALDTALQMQGQLIPYALKSDAHERLDVGERRSLRTGEPHRVLDCGECLAGGAGRRSQRRKRRPVLR